MPMVGDKYTALIGGHSMTFRVVDRELEYLPDQATIHLTLGLIDER
jgi:hypothetical protein